MPAAIAAAGPIPLVESRYDATYPLRIASVI